MPARTGLACIYSCLVLSLICCVFVANPGARAQTTSGQTQENQEVEQQRQEFERRRQYSLEIELLDARRKKQMRIFQLGEQRRQMEEREGARLSIAKLKEECDLSLE